MKVEYSGPGNGFSDPIADKDTSSILSSCYRHRRYLIQILQDMQAILGYLSEDTMLAVARFLDLPSSSVWSVATFYNQFRFTQPGKHPVRVCLGTACHLASAQLVLESMSRELKIEIGGTTEDGEFDLDRVACIGCCALAPVVTIGGDIYPKMTPLKVEEVLVSIRPSLHDENLKKI